MSGQGRTRRGKKEKPVSGLKTSNRIIDLELLGDIITQLKHHRELYRHGCFIASQPEYDDLKVIGKVFSCYDRLTESFLRYSNFDPKKWRAMLKSYFINVEIPISQGWIKTINGKLTCKDCPSCKLRARPITNS